MHIFAYAPVEFNCLKAIAKTFILLPDKSSSLKETFWTMLQFAGLPLQWIQTFPSLDRTLRIHYINSNLISHQLKFSKVVNQSSNLMLLISVADMLRQWKQWTFKMISRLFALTTSEPTVHWNLTESWPQCQMVLRIVLVNSWRITETGALLYYSSEARYLTHCTGRTKHIGCSWRVRCCWTEYLKWTLLSSKYSIICLHFSIDTLVHSLQIMLQLFPMKLLP